MPIFSFRLVGIKNDLVQGAIEMIYKFFLARRDDFDYFIDDQENEDYAVNENYALYEEDNEFEPTTRPIIKHPSRK